MKKVIVILLVFVLSSCSVSDKPVPMVIYDFEDEYLYKFKETITEKSEGLFDIEVYDSQNSQIVQNEILEEISNPPLYIINPVDRLSAFTIIEKANQTNTPIIFFNRQPLESDMQMAEEAYYIGADPIESAILQAEIVIDIFGNNPDELNDRDLNDDNVIQAVILKGQTGHQDAELRTEHVVKEIQNNGYEIEVLEVIEAEFNEQIAKTEMSLAIDEYGPQIEVVISNNDHMALGAFEALIDKDYFYDKNGTGRIDRDIDDWVPIVGIDGIEEVRELVDDGFIYGTVSIDSDRFANAIVQLTNAILSGKNIETIGYQIHDGKYIWIEYKKYTTY